jgi:hypothetical protein
MTKEIRPEQRAKFERMGLAFVRQWLQMGVVDSVENLEVQQWIMEESRRVERKETLRYWGMLVMTFIAAVAAVIAAVPVVKEWLH